MKGALKDTGRTLPNEPACEREGVQARERAGAHTREGAAMEDGGLGGAAAVGHGARARVRARARVSMAATVEGAGADRWIAVPTMMCARPAPFAVVLFGASPAVLSMLASVRRGDLVDVEGELRLANMGDEGGRLVVVVATVELVDEVVPEAADET